MTNKMPDLEDMTVREQQEYIRTVFREFDNEPIDNVIYLSTVEKDEDED